MTHTVESGECFESIADKYGYFWETLWNHPGNKELRELRDHHAILLPGDQVYIPDQELKKDQRDTGFRHRFRRKGVPSRLNVQLGADGEPFDNAPYRLIIDNDPPIDGVTDPQGWIRHPLRPSAKQAQITLWPSEPVELQIRYRMTLGRMDPIQSLTGVQGRLLNLGYYEGPLDGTESEALTKALELFQADWGIQITGTADQKTRDKLDELMSQSQPLGV